jgi:Mor family transcriptional regulator
MMNNDNYPEILQTLKDSIVRSLVEQGVAKKIAEQCAHNSAEQIRAEWGGTPVYICKGLSYEISQRDLEIWNKFTGKNHHQLCKEYSITIVWLYKILGYQRKAQIKRQQVDLFPEDDL